MTAESLAPALVRRRPAFSFGDGWSARASLSWLMVALPVAFLIALVGYPFFYGIWISLQNRPVAQPGVFVGFANFVADWHDSVFSAGGAQHFRLHHCRHAPEDGGRSRSRAGHEPGFQISRT